MSGRLGSSSMAFLNAMGEGSPGPTPVRIAAHGRGVMSGSDQPPVSRRNRRLGRALLVVYLGLVLLAVLFIILRRYGYA